MYMTHKSEMQDMQEEHQREMEALLEGVRQMSAEVKRLSLIIDHFIPQEFLHLIQEHTHWNDEIGEWQLVSSRVTGTMRRGLQNIASSSTEFFRNAWLTPETT